MVLQTMRRILWVVLAGILCACSQNLHQDVFDDLWGTIHEKYVYTDFNGVDWEAARSTYQSEIDTGLTDVAFWGAMSDMVSLLGDDHTHFLSPAETEEQDQLRGGALNYVGIGLLFHPLPEKGYAVVLSPFPGGPAEQVGIAAHDRLLTVDGIPFCCHDNGTARVDLVLGPEGTEVSLTVQTPGEAPRDLTVTRAAVQVDFPVLFRRLEGNIGYLLVPTFQVDDIAEKTEARWRELTASGPLDGFVLDLRTSRGGLESELTGILALFVDGDMGDFLSREGTRPLAIQGRDVAGSQSVPMAVLVSGITESFAEVMAGVLQETGRAFLVGSQTAGNVEAVHRHDFSDGSSAWIAQETFLPPSGINWERLGVSPDVEIILGWDEFTTDSEDLVLRQALVSLFEEKRE
jgi:carboxyl-terminal processing protease